MRRTFMRVLSGFAIGTLVSGCGDSGYSPNVSGTPSTTDSVAEQAAPADADTTATGPSAIGAADADESAQASTGTDSQAAPVQATADTDGEATFEETSSEETTLGEVGVGVGRKGQAYGGNIYTAPLAANFRARERIVFDIEIKRHMNFFEATHERLPESHEEFMTEIIKANGIQLPELPEGQEYFYDATDGELKRKIPKPPGQ